MNQLVDQIIDFEQGEQDHDETVAMFQGMIDNGTAWTFQGFYGRTANDLIQAGFCTLGPVGHRDTYGNYVPSRDEVEPGSPGSPEFVAAREDD